MTTKVTIYLSYNLSISYFDPCVCAKMIALK